MPSSSASPELVCLVPCMGRLGHLRASLPMLLRTLEPADRVVLSDWSCPKRSGDWAESLGDERVSVVRTPGKRWFHKTACLNRALARALELGPRYLCAIDADTLCARSFRARLVELLRPGGRFVICALRDGHFPGRDLSGLLGAETGALVAAGGWGEQYVGYGCEDYDARLRLLGGGLRWTELELEHVSPLGHPHWMRAANYRLGQNRSHLRNRTRLRRAWGGLLASPDGRRMQNLTARRPFERRAD